MSQAPRLADPLEDGKRAVTLTQRQQPAARKPERATDERSVRSAVRDDDDRPAGVRSRERFEHGPGAGFEVRDALAVRKRELSDARHPLGEPLGFPLLDLGGGEPLP